MSGIVATPRAARESQYTSALPTEIINLGRQSKDPERNHCFAEFDQA
jgi:hypothetical protein